MTDSNPFSRLASGLWLPRRGILIPWGASFSSLSQQADSANDWLPYGHQERYGQLHWRDEPVFGDDKNYKGFTGGVIAYVRGNPPTVRTFSLGVSDDIWLKESAFQYHYWMNHLIKLFGEPRVDTQNLVAGHHIVPPCAWRQGEVAILLSYAFMKGDPYLDLSLAHDRLPLHG